MSSANITVHGVFSLVLSFSLNNRVYTHCEDIRVQNLMSILIEKKKGFRTDPLCNHTRFLNRSVVPITHTVHMLSLRLPYIHLPPAPTSSAPVDSRILVSENKSIYIMEISFCVSKRICIYKILNDIFQNK